METSIGELDRFQARPSLSRRSTKAQPARFSRKADFWPARVFRRQGQVRAFRRNVCRRRRVGKARFSVLDVSHPFSDLQWVMLPFVLYSLKATGEQIDDRIVEVYWETSENRWRMMRFRDDKPNGNHVSVVENIIQSIIDGVEKEDVGGFL